MNEGLIRLPSTLDCEETEEAFGKIKMQLFYPLKVGILVPSNQISIKSCEVGGNKQLTFESELQLAPLNSCFIGMVSHEDLN